MQFLAEGKSNEEIGKEVDRVPIPVETLSGGMMSYAAWAADSSCESASTASSIQRSL